MDPSSVMDFVSAVLQLEGDELEGFVKGPPEGVLQNMRVDVSTFDVLRPVWETCVRCAREAPSLQGFVEMLKAVSNDAIQKGVSVEELTYLNGMSMSPLFRACVTVVAIVVKHKHYWHALFEGPPEAGDAWFENLTVCRLNREGARSQVSGNALTPFTVGALAKCNLSIKSWWQPYYFTRHDWRRQLPRKLQPALTLSEQPKFVEAALSAGEGKIVLAGGAVLSMINRGIARDFDFWVVGCATVDEALEAVRRSARAAVASILDGQGRPHGPRLLRVLSAVTPNAITILAQYEEYVRCLQFILRAFNDVEHVLTSFDLGPCCFAVGADGVIWCTRRAQLAFAEGIAVADPCQHCTPGRAHKYHEKGFTFVLPVWGDWKQKVLDPMVGLPYEKLQELAWQGGAKGIVASAFVRASNNYVAPREPNETEVGQLYECLHKPENLFNKELRTRFLARFPYLRTEVCEMTDHDWQSETATDMFATAPRSPGNNASRLDRLLGDDLFAAASERRGARWAKDPAERMHGATDFYKGFEGFEDSE